jgi:hypothetical protein
MTTTSHGACELLIVTASLTSGIACVARGMAESVKLISQVIRMDHLEWESILSVGTVEYHSSKTGPFPNHQLRISVRPSAGFAALKLYRPRRFGTGHCKFIQPQGSAPGGETHLQWFNRLGVPAQRSHTGSGGAESIAGVA